MGCIDMLGFNYVSQKELNKILKIYAEDTNGNKVELHDLVLINENASGTSVSFQIEDDEVAEEVRKLIK
jgi:hypothetical protein